MPQEYPIILRGFPGTVQVVDGVEYAPGRLADVYLPVEAAKPVPTILFLHAGGWLHGDRKFGPDLGRFFTQRGFAMVSIDYRLSDEALFPAAVHDVKTAVRWMRSVAGEYGFNPNRIGVWGLSAGGHLALSLGMIPDSAKLDLECAATTPLPKVAAVIDWYGIYDVGDVIDGPNFRAAAARWFGSLPNRMEIAKRVSPMTYVRAGLPPIMIIHGDADPTVPYPQAVKLKADLDRLKVPNQLVTIPGGGHGNFTPEQRTMIYRNIREFLAKNGLTK